MLNGIVHRLFVVMTLNFAVASLACAQANGSIDLRNSTPAVPEGDHTIKICARPTDQAGGGFGHAFVVFRRHGASSQDEFLAVGFGPEASLGVVSAGRC